jgi:hypothetical protein
MRKLHGIKNAKVTTFEIINLRHKETASPVQETVASGMVPGRSPPELAWKTIIKE